MADNWDLCLRLAKQHHIDNDIPLAPDWQDQYQDILCRLLPPGFSRYEDGSQAALTIDTRFTSDDWVNGMTVLAAVVTGDEPLVDQATAEARARICAACPVNIQLKGCTACVAMADWVVKINGGKKTEADNKLASCAACKCSNRAQVWVRAELLAKGVTAEQRAKFDLLPWCWKGEALRALEQ